MLGGVKEFTTKLGRFLHTVKPDLPVAVESRNPNYLGRHYFEFLKERNLPHVYLSGYYMSEHLSVYRKYGNTGAFTLFRLHSEDHRGMERRTGRQWNDVIEDRSGELAKIVDLAAEEIRLVRDFYVSINNHYEGSSPISIQHFLQRRPSEQR